MRRTAISSVPSVFPNSVGVGDGISSLWGSNVICFIQHMPLMLFRKKKL